MSDFPTVVHVPHAALAIPQEYLADYRPEVIDRELRVMTDWYCGELFDLGRKIISCPVSRLVCDVERFRDDSEESMAGIGMGWFYLRCSDGRILRSDSAARRAEILRRYYDPHHAALEAAVRGELSSHGRCLIIDGHSFYPTPLPHEPDQSDDRPDFCIGADSFHTPPGLTEACVSFLKSRGYSAKVNAPFAGSIVPMAFYRRDVRVSSVMLEVNRRLYMDGEGEKKASFSAVKRDIGEWLAVAEGACFAE